MRMIQALMAAATVLVAVSSGAAQAGTYNWTISGSGYIGSGTLTTGLAGYNNPWPCATCVTVGDSISSFSGVLNGAPVALLPPQDVPDYPGPGVVSDFAVGFAGNDDLIYPHGPYLDWGDLGFSASGVDYNVFNGNYAGHPGDWLPATNNEPNGIYSNPVSFTLSVVPEPATWALMAIGVAGLGAARRFPRKTSATVTVAP